MKNSKTEKILILGKSGSGKDHLLRGLIKLGLRYSPKITTRPKRELETEGVEYEFTDNQTFEKMIADNLILVHQKFIIGGETWYYGISRKSFQENQTFILTPHEFSQLEESDLKNTFVVYLDIESEIRRKRIQKREDRSDSIDRRMEADEIDFRDFKKYDLKITDPEFEAEWVYDLMN